ncbi:MAG: tRNA pseudouridine(38-40) synthase TruA [Kiloniellales bacterium]
MNNASNRRPAPGTTRYRLLVEYDGGAFVGWQRQDNGPSVQAALEEAVERFCGERPLIEGAGRTDSGVHALGQVAHLDLAREVKLERLREAMNFHVRPAPVAVLEATLAPPDFHARFSANGRHYRYRIANRRAPLTLERGRAWFVPQPLKVAAMDEAAKSLIGRHDFSSFRASECQAPSPVKTLDALDCKRVGDELVVEARARSFLHNQVRIMVGTLVEVGLGRRSADWVAAALAARDRRKAGPTAPPEGLYLVAVRY